MDRKMAGKIGCYICLTLFQISVEQHKVLSTQVMIINNSLKNNVRGQRLDNTASLGISHSTDK